jgi:prepilin signal peptidase PulO-like enzyme (type II secretory pathway)
VELLTGVLFVGAALVATDLMSLLHLLFFVSVLIVIAVYDIYHMVIPDELVGALAVTAMTYKFYLLIIGYPVQAFWLDIAVALFTSLFFMSLWRFSKGTWIGFGDVKLVIPLVLWIGYQSAFSMVVLAFWIGAVVGVLSILGYKLYRRGQPHLRFMSQQLTMKSAIPFAPFLILGYLTVLFFGIDVIALLSYVP